jgi:heme iron utilization protein
MSELGKSVKSLLLSQKHGVLAVIDRQTHSPYGALVNYACDHKGWPIFLFSALARHTQALIEDSGASLLVSELPSHGDVLTGMRASIMGKCVSLGQDQAAKDAYLALHPYAAGYAEFGDFSFWRLEPTLIHTVAGFGRIATLPATEVFGV